ncbi:MAG: hypothetical protein ACJ8FZ_09440, partial [Bradyrhizobium sp.]
MGELPQGSMAQIQPGKVPNISVTPRPVTISQAMKVTKWSTYSGDLNVSEQQPEPKSTETGSLATGPASSDVSTQSEPVTAQAAAGIESPKIAPKQEETAPKSDAPKSDAPKSDAPKSDVPKADPPKEAPNVEVPTVEAARPEAPRFPGKLMIMSPGPRSWDGDSAGTNGETEAKAGTSGKRRVAAMAAVVVLATAAGALGGALATAGVGHFVV